MYSSPQTQANSILKSINELSPSDAKNQLMIASLKNKAKALLKIDAAGSYVVLGALECIERHIEKSREYHEKALNIRPNDIWAIMNYATSLEKLGFYQESISLAEKAFSLATMDMDILNALIVYSAKAGAMQKANILLSEWDKRSPEQPHRLSQTINGMADILSKDMITDSQSLRFFDTAISILHKYQVCFREVEFSCWDNTVNVLLHVDSSIDNLSNLNIELAESLACENFIPSLSKSISFIYVPE